MIIGKVVGTLVSTVKHPAYAGFKLLLVQPFRGPEETPEPEFIAIDRADAGIGDAVLVLREGSGARQVTGIVNAPIISVIVGILDSVELFVEHKEVSTT